MGLFRGVFGGAIGPWPPPPFGSPGLQNCIEKWAKLRHGPPPLQVGHQALGSKSADFEWRPFFFCSPPDFGRKTGWNLSEDLFFFALHLILGETWDEIWAWQFQILIYVPLKFSEVSAPPPPPPFQNPAYATGPFIDLFTTYFAIWFTYKNKLKYLKIFPRKHCIFIISQVAVNLARSQDFAKGGFFGRWKQQSTNLTQIFNSLYHNWNGFSDWN